MDEKVEIPDGDERRFCLEYMQDAVLGGDGKDEEDMRQFLKQKGVLVPASATFVQVLSLLSARQSRLALVG